MHKGGKCAPGHTTHSATQKCRVHTTCCNKQHTYTYTQHMHRTQMICTNYYLQQPSSTLSMGSRREGQHGQLTWTQWTVNDTYIFAIITCFIHLQKNSIAAVSVSSGGSVAIISPACLHWACNPLTASVRRLFAISGHCLKADIHLYTSATELHPKCGVILHMPQYWKVIPRQVATLLNP